VGKALRAGVIAAKVMPEAEYDHLYALAGREFTNRRGGGILPFYLAAGQKPL
jgi:hypothetical protein